MFPKAKEGIVILMRVHESDAGIIRATDRGAGAGARWPQRLVAGLLLSMVIFGLNFHLVGWQIYGWAGMVVENRQATGSWAEAMEVSFNAEKPCDVCRSVEMAMDASGKVGPASASRGDLTFLPLFLTTLAERSPSVLPPPDPFSRLVSNDPAFCSRAVAPAVPPPRALSA
jgi:hypothetical protein